MSQQLFARTGWAGKAVAAPSGEVGSLSLPFDLDDEAHDDLVIKADVPKKLKKALNSGLPIINHSCVRENAERILKWYEGVIINHVLAGQAKTEGFKALTGRRLDKESTAAAKS